MQHSCVTCIKKNLSTFFSVNCQLKPQHVAEFYNMFQNAMAYFVLHIFVTRLCSYNKDYTRSCGVRKKLPLNQSLA